MTTNDFTTSFRSFGPSSDGLGIRYLDCQRTQMNGWRVELLVLNLQHGRGGNDGNDCGDIEDGAIAAITAATAQSLTVLIGFLIFEPRTLYKWQISAGSATLIKHRRGILGDSVESSEHEHEEPFGGLGNLMSILWHFLAPPTFPVF